MAKGSPSQAPLKLRRLRKWARPWLRKGYSAVTKKFLFLFFFALNTKTTKISLYKLFFPPKQPPKQNDPPKSKQNKILSSVYHLSSKTKAIYTQPRDWEERGLIYMVTTLAEGSRGEPWSG